MDTEATPLAHQAIQIEGGVAKNLIVLGEELLELVNDQQDARHTGVGVLRAIGGQVLRCAKELLALFEFSVATFELAQRKLALRLGGDVTRMGEVMLGK